MPPKDHVEQYTTVAENVLAMCRKIQPNFWNPETNPDMASAWGYVFATKPFAPACYYEAVGVFYAEDHSGERPTPGQIVHFAQVVRDRWEADPAKRAEMNAHREFLQRERDRAIAAGTFGNLRGHRERALPEKSAEPSKVRNLLEAIGVKRAKTGHQEASNA